MLIHEGARRDAKQICWGIGDFGKFGLLRWLTGITAGDNLKGLRLGVVWYLFNDEENAGKITEYSYMRTCDKFLYKRLQKILEHQGTQGQYRTIEALQRWGILPGNTAYFETRLNFLGTPFGSSRKDERNRWMHRAIHAMKPADLVFLDPDNGLSDKPSKIAKSVRQFGWKGPKYAYLEDLKSIFEQGKSLVIYHHLRSKGKAKAHIRYVSKVLRHKFKTARVWAFWYHRGTARAYFIVVHPNQQDVLLKRLESFRENQEWCTGRKSPFEYILSH